MQDLPYRDAHHTWHIPGCVPDEGASAQSTPEADLNEDPAIVRTSCEGCRSTGPGQQHLSSASNGLTGDALYARLGWQPLHLAGAPGGLVMEVLNTCTQLDHSVLGVTHMIGGSGEGYRRWEYFKAHGLQQYAARRNSAMLRCVLASDNIYTVLQYDQDTWTHQTL